MNSYILLSNKKWHEDLYKKLKKYYPNQKWILINNKKDFNNQKLSNINPKKIFIQKEKYNYKL